LLEDEDAGSWSQKSRIPFARQITLEVIVLV